MTGAGWKLAYALCAVCAVSADAEGEWVPRGSFAVQSTVLLSELGGAPRDAGYRLAGALHVRPAPGDPQLLLFRVRDVTLQTHAGGARDEWRARGPAWPPAGAAAWRWRRGAELLLPRAPPHAADYMRALTSLFQFQVEEGRRNETDVSGDCEVAYETLSPTVFRKTKRRCSWEAAAAEEAGVRVRRVARYTRAPAGGLLALHAEEVLWMDAAPWGEGESGEERGAGLKARSWHALERLEETADAPDADEELEPAPLALPLRAPPEPPPPSAAEAARLHGAALGGEAPGEGGDAAAAEALAPLLRALAAAPAQDLAALLRDDDMQPLLPGLCRALGLAGSAAGWAAAGALLQPAAEDALEPLALLYLQGLALAPRVAPAVAAAALALADEARRPALAEAALLAGAAAARAAGPAAAAAARERLTRGLARAREPEARARLLRALGNLRAGDAAPLLLAAAERGAPPDAEAALDALRPLPLPPALATRALALAGNASRSLAERALALELGAAALADDSASALVRLARALGAERGAAAGELRRALGPRLAALAERGPLPPDLASWDARAPPGTTSVLRRRLGWRAAGAEAELASAQLAARAVLRRGRVALRARGADLLALELWTAGLDSLVGGSSAEEGEAEEAEEPAAGLRVWAGGVQLRPLRLFAGQAELLGHVWAGTGSAPTPVLRAALPLPERRALVPLAAGVALALAADGGAALALDAQGSVSLWQRSARARLALRAAARVEARAALAAGAASLSARAALAGEARLRIAVDLDMYDGVALCVRAEAAPLALRREAALEARAGGAAARRMRSARWPAAGRGLALGRANDAACRARAAADPDDDL